MEHIAELIGITPAEVLGTCSFYEMFKREPVGEYLVNVCTNIACMLARRRGAPRTTSRTASASRREHHRRRRLHHRGRRVHRACTEAPCLQVNYRYFNKVTPTTPTRSSTTCSTAVGPTRCPGTGSSPAPASTCPPKAGRATPCPAWPRIPCGSRRRAGGRDRAGDERHRGAPSAACAGDADIDPSRLGRPRRRPHPRALPRHRWLRGAEGALAQGARRGRSTRSKAASLLGRGGAGFPAGTKWGFCPPGVWPGTSSSTATSPSRAPTRTGS